MNGYVSKRLSVEGLDLEALCIFLLDISFLFFRVASGSGIVLGFMGLRLML